MEPTAPKGILAGALIVITYVADSLGVLFVIFLAFLALDYITGVSVAFVEKKPSSKVGLKGIIKKISYIGLVISGILFDLTLAYATKEMGIELPIKSIFGFLIICWFIANEAISIAENIGHLGAPVPAFLLKVFKLFQRTINKAGEKNIPEGKDEDK